jgi:glycosyltransferase involved in cell wall biosynthesis
LPFALNIKQIMRVTLYSNFLNHHQTPFCDAMYSKLGDNFTFVSTERMPEAFLKNGYPDCTNYIYNLKSYTDAASYNKAIQLGNESDIVITGATDDIFIRGRLKQNKHTFRYSERFFKEGMWLLLNLRYLRRLFLNHTRHRRKNLYMLSASAYAANDLNLIFAYPNKKFKWAYFTEVKKLDIKQIIAQKPVKRIELLWVARFIPLKHPELAVQLCHELKKKGYEFHLNMIGTGETGDFIRNLIVELNLQECIDILPSMPNSDVHNYMRKANIYLFTSDKREGWGAVLNEAMSNGCAVVASHEIGATPFLIKHNKNGLIFKSCSLSSLLEQTEKLINNQSFRNEISENAYYTLYNEWSPENAASNFLKLAKSFLENRPCIIDSGPCSRTKNMKGYFDESNVTG